MAREIDPELSAYLPGVYRTPARPASQIDTFLDREIRRDREDEVKKTIAANPPADKVARTTRLARQAGVPPMEVEGNEDLIEKAQNADLLSNVFNVMPMLGQYFSDNPRALVASQKDHKSIGLLGEGLQFLKDFDPVMAFAKAVDEFDRTDRGSMTSHAGTPLMAGVAAIMGDPDARVALPVVLRNAPAAVKSGFYSQGSGALGYLRGVADDEGMPRISDWAARYAGSLDDRAKAAMPRTGDWLTDQVLGGFSNVPSTVTTLGVGIGGRALGLSTKAAALLGSSVGGVVAGGQWYNEARAQGVDPRTAFLYANAVAAFEVGGEYFGTRKFLQLSDQGAGVITRFLKSQIPEAAGELFSETGESFTSWAVLPENRNKTLGDWAASLPERYAATVVQTLVASGVSNVTISAFEKGFDTYAAKRRAAEGNRVYDQFVKARSEMVGKLMEAAQARANGEVLTFFEKAAATNEMRKADADGYAEMVGTLAAQNGIESVMVPAEAVREYMQSDGYDRFSDPFESYRDQVDEAFAVGGDVVLPADFALGTLPGTPAWSALRDDIRLTSGGMSLRQAQSFDDAMADVVAEFETEMQAEYTDLNAQLDAQGKLLQSVRDKLMNAGFTPYAAAQQAELIARRITTRAARMGQEVTGAEFTTEVRQVLPPELAKARAADATDLVINALRRGKDATVQSGPSLIEWIAKNGGIWDGEGRDGEFKGGDFKAMGLDKWHLGKKGRRKVVRDPKLGAGNRGADVVLVDAIEAGYFPELNGYNEAADAAVLMDAINAELAGSPRYAADPRVDGYRAAAAELDQMLAERGLDPAGMTDAELRAVIAQMDEAGQGGFEQLPDMLDIDGVMRPTRNSEGQPLAGSEAGVRAFYRWFADSKVVDEEGRPLVVYHGTAAEFDAFKPSWRGAMYFAFTPEGAIKGASAGASDRMGGAPNKLMPVYVRAERIGSLNFSAETEAALLKFPDEVTESEWAEIADAVALAGVRDFYRGEGDSQETWRIRKVVPRSLTETVKTRKNAIDGGMMGGYPSQDEKSFVARMQDKGFDGYLVEDEAGISLAAFSPTQIKSVNNRGTFDPADPRILMQSPREYYQGQTLSDGPRGRIRFEQVPIIELFQSRNLSTLLHELSHQYLEELRSDAESPDAPAQLVQDWETVKAWFAANGHPIVDGIIPVEAHEMWARGNERYLMEGKAPSAALARVFETLRGWMRSVYEKVEALRSPITPEIREVFDRLYATDEEIQATRESQALMPLFKDAAGLLTGPEFEAYQALFDEARVAANGEVLAKTMATIRRRVTAEYREQRAKVEEEVTARVDGQPLFKALRNLKAEPINADWLRDNMGEDVFSLLPKRVPPIWKDRGAHPDSVAEMSGYATGRQMVEALIGAELAHRQAKEGGDLRPLRVRAIQTETDAEMNAMVGDPLGDGTIEREALAAVNSEKQGEVMASELRAISRRTGQRPTPYKIARQWARGKVRQGAYNVEASPAAIQRHTRAVAKAGGEAERALMAGDFEKAFAAKQRQMLSSALLAEAKAAGDEVDAAVKRLSNVARNRKRDSIDPDYWDQAQAVLAGYDFAPRTEKLMREREGFERWAAARIAEGEEIQIPERMVAPGTNYTRMTVEQIMGIDDTVKSILHLGRRKKELLLGKERRDWHEARGEWLDGAENLPERPAGPDRNAGPSKVRGILSNLVRIDMMAKIMDGGDPNGLMTRTLANGAKTADNTFARLQKEVLEPIANAYMSMKGGRLFDRVSTPEWIDYRTGKPQVFMRSDLLAIASNLGSESNLNKMLSGEALLFKGQEHLAPTLEGVTAMLNRELNEAEWQMVITGWRRVEVMGEEAFAAERELTGLTPEKIEPRMVQTPFGEVEGGYWPAVYDTDAVRAADAGVSLDAVKGDDFETLLGKHGVGTNKGYTISRTDFVAPMLLNYEAVLFGHVNQVAKRVAYQAWAKNALKVIRDRRVKAMWARKLGEEYHAQLEPWLRDTINQGQIAGMGHLAEVNSLLRAARMNLTAMGLVFRATTLIAQAGGLPNSMKAIGAANVVKGFRLYAQDRGAMIARIMDASPLMARRLNEFDRDQAAALANMQNPPTSELGRKLKPLADARDKWNAAGFHLIGAIQLYAVDLPTWAGAYDKAMRSGADGGLDMDHDAAVDFADRMVEEAQGAGRPAQLAAIQRSGEMSRIVTLFYTFFGTVLNYQWEMTQDIRGGNYRKAAVSAGWVMVVAPLVSALIGDAIRGDLPDDDDDDDTWLAWAMRKVFFGMFSGIPIVRDFANQAERKASGKYAPDPVTPWQRIGTAVAGGGKDAFAAISQTGSYRVLQSNATFLPEPTEVSDKWLKHGIEAVGFATGTGTGQVASTAQFVSDVNRGEANPDGAGDWMEGITTGRIKED